MCVEDAGELVAGLSGWTWGEAAGIAMTWVAQEPAAASSGARVRLISLVSLDGSQAGRAHSARLPALRSPPRSARDRQGTAG